MWVCVYGCDEEIEQEWKWLEKERAWKRYGKTVRLNKCIMRRKIDVYKKNDKRER